MNLIIQLVYYRLNCIFDLHFVNGRLFYLEGNFMFVQQTMVVDYKIASRKLFFFYISYFDLEDRDKTVHFPVYCQISWFFTSPLIHTGEKPYNIIQQNNTTCFCWNKERKEEFYISFLWKDCKVQELMWQILIQLLKVLQKCQQNVCSTKRR